MTQICKKNLTKGLKLLCYVEQFVDTSKNRFCLKYFLRNKNGAILEDEANTICLKNDNLEPKIRRLAMTRCFTAALP